MNYFDEFFSKTDIDFIDRDDLIEIVKSEYCHMLSEKGYFKVFSIYGMGGIGKSRFLSESKTILDKIFSSDSRKVILYLSLEISDSTIFLNALVQLRKQIREICPLFDYALLTYWKRTQINKLDDDFMDTLKKQWFESAHLLGALFSYPLTNISQLLSISMDTIIDIIEKGYKFFKQKYYSSLFLKKIQNISDISTNDLQKLLGSFLGMEINRLYCEKNLVIIIDAYKHYTSSVFIDWLESLIKSSSTGLFIIASREKIPLSFINKNQLILRELKKLPKTEVYKLLQNEIPSINDQTINHIMEVSGCIPIYLELAINTYHSINNNNTNIAIMYKSRDEIIEKFFSHLKENEREFMLGLSFIQIFNQKIFIMLLELFPETNILAYNKIRSLTLVSTVTNDNYMYKIHNVIHKNVINILDYDTRYLIFEKYIYYISTEIIILASENQSIILYRHLIQLIIDNNFIIQQQESELLLNIFFQIKQMQMVVMPIGISGYENYEPLKDIFYFTKAIAEEREDTQIRLSYLSNIDFENNCLGKHNKSLRIIHGYLMQWSGNANILANYLNIVYPKLRLDEIREWYYAQAQIAWSDHHTIIGDFKQAKKILYPFYKNIQLYPEQENSIFQSTRHMGHLYRINFLPNEANKFYLSTLNSEGKFNNSIQEIYILTNMCETNCYLNPDLVYKYCYNGLKLGKILGDSKSLAKIYYSLAITCLHRRKFKHARKYIHKSFYYYKIDGYELGLLYPMLSKIYYQYSLGLQLKTNDFERFLQKMNVYGFMNLPVAILKQNTSNINILRTKYKWLDFNKTINNYHRFFSLIAP